MKFKLDENFGVRTQHIFRSLGHDVQTVRDEGLQGCSDQTLFDVAGKEKRCLVTLDLDFSDVLRFPPESSSGIVILRIPQNPTLSLWNSWFGSPFGRLRACRSMAGSGSSKSVAFAYISQKISHRQHDHEKTALLRQIDATDPLDRPQVPV